MEYAEIERLIKLVKAEIKKYKIVGMEMDATKDKMISEL